MIRKKENKTDYYQMGVNYLFGLNGYKINKSKAYSLFNKGVKNEDYDCMYGLYLMFKNGQYVQSDMEVALMWLHKAGDGSDLAKQELFDLQD
ncbi:MAG: hypothetical protein WCR67_03865 [Bacilli bacterium]